MFDFMYPDGPWRNDACVGYAIMAMELAGLDYETVCTVVAKMADCFDDTTVEGAVRYYCRTEG